MNIPLSDLMVENRKFFFENKIMDWSDGVLALRLKKLLSSRKKMNESPWKKKQRLNCTIGVPVLKSKYSPQVAKESFNLIATKQQTE